jgi:DNA polymerase I-like protein with 3'-5' exonuclease and polymerase domains
MVMVNGGLDSAQPYGSAARKYLDCGWPVFDLPVGAKFPPPSGCTGWRGSDQGPGDVEMRQRSKPKANIGLRMPPSVCGIDVDAYDGRKGGATLARLEAELGPLPDAPILTSRDDGVSGIRCYRLPGDEVLAGQMGAGIETLQRHHRFAVGAPSVHPSGRVYKWLNPDRTEMAGIPRPEDLPLLPMSWLAKFEAKPRVAGGPVASGGMIEMFLMMHDREVACQRIEAELKEFAANEGSRHDAMLKAQLAIVSCAAMGHRGGTDGLERLHDAFLAALGDDREGEGEWYSALAGAVAIVTVSPPSASGCCPSDGGLEPLFDDWNPGEAADQHLVNLATFPPLFGMFRRGGELVFAPRISDKGYKPPVLKPGESNGPAQVQPLDSQGMFAYFHEKVWLYRERIIRGRIVRERTLGHGQAWSIILKRGPNDERIPALTGVAHTPCLRADGSVLDVPGYDQDSGMLYLPANGLRVPEIPEVPTAAQIAAAAQVLTDLVAQFPWISESDRDNYVASWMSPIFFPLLSAPGPFLCISAPMKGSGKSLLSQILEETHGAVMRGDVPSESEEVRKQITSILRETTAPCVVWDNIDKPVGSPKLASLVTSPVWTDRVLGATQETALSAKRLWCLNGNNLRLSGDMARRGLWASIDPKRPLPWLRTGFKYDKLRAHIRKERGAVLAAMLTLARAWVCEGMPRIESRTDSFTDWYGVMGGVLSVAGLGEVGATESDHETMGEEDTELQEFLEALWDSFGSEQFASGEAAAACIGEKGGYSALGEALPSELHDKLRESAYQPPAIAKSLGKYFARNDGRWTNHGLCVRQEKRKEDPSKNAWHVVRHEPSSPVIPYLPKNPVRPTPTDTSTSTTFSNSDSLARTDGDGRGEWGNGNLPEQGIPLAFDLETCSLARLWTEEPWPGFVRLMSVHDGRETWLVTDHDEMREILSGASLLIGHNSFGFDAVAVERHLGLEIASKTVDTLVLSRLVEPPASMTDEAGKRNFGRLDYDLDSLGLRRLGVGKAGSIDKLATKFNRKAKLADKYESIPVDDPEFQDYAARDAELAWRLYHDLLANVPDEAYWLRELRLAREVFDITMKGFAVDPDTLRKRVYEDDLATQQHLDVLRDRLGPVNKRLGKEAKEKLGDMLAAAGMTAVVTAGGSVATDKDTMRALIDRDGDIGSIARAVLALNGERGLPAQVAGCIGTDGRVHCSIDMNTQASGRWSVTNPGLTTFGKKSERLLRDRDLFVAKDGHVLYARDLSNIDVRGMAALSQDKAMIERLQPGLEHDWHEQVAIVVWGDAGKRESAKALAHAINYNAGPATVAANAGITHDEAVAVIATLTERFPDLTAFKARIVAAAQAGEVITNGWGKRLNVSVNRSVTQAPGLSGQGWARDAVMECLLRLADAGQSQRIVAHVHDEFIFEIPLARYDEVVAKIADAMTFEKDGVPVLSEPSKGSPAATWGALYR